MLGVEEETKLDNFLTFPVGKCSKNCSITRIKRFQNEVEIWKREACSFFFSPLLSDRLHDVHENLHNLVEQRPCLIHLHYIWGIVKQ